MSIKTSLALIGSLILVACGGSTPKPDSAPPEGSGAATPSDMPSSDTPEEKSSDKGGDTGDTKGGDTKGGDTKAATAPKLDKPASESTLSGKSVSSVGGDDVQASLKKLGWVKDQTASSSKAGSYEVVKIDIEKGKSKGYVEITRPASDPGDSSSAGTAPADQKDAKEKDGAATYYDDAADVLVTVSVEGKNADAKKLLGQLVKIKKAAAKKPEKAATPAPAEGGGKKK